MVYAGEEGFQSEMGPWSVLGTKALGSEPYIPDFDAFLSGGCRLMRIHADAYSGALRMGKADKIVGVRAMRQLTQVGMALAQHVVMLVATDGYFSTARLLSGLLATGAYELKLCKQGAALAAIVPCCQRQPASLLSEEHFRMQVLDITSKPHDKFPESQSGGRSPPMTPAKGLNHVGSAQGERPQIPRAPAAGVEGDADRAANLARRIQSERRLSVDTHAARQAVAKTSQSETSSPHANGTDSKQDGAFPSDLNSVV